MDLINLIRFQFKMLIKSPVMLINFFLYPIILTLIIGYLTQNSFGDGYSSYEFYSISMMIFIFVGTGIGCAYNYLDEPKKAGNSRIILMPVKESNIYLAQIISGTIAFSFAVILSMLFFSIFLNVDYNNNAVIIYLAFSTLIFLSNTLGVFLCTILDKPFVINLIFNLIQMVLCVLGGTFFSMESLGKVPAILAKLSPVKWFLDGILYSMYDNSNTLLMIVILVNFMLGMVFILLCKRTFKTEKYI